MIDLAFIATLLTVGALVSWRDIKEGLIPNKFLATGFLIGVVLYTSLFSINVFSLQSQAIFTDLRLSILNGFFAALLGFLGWKVGFWSAGDGKLFAFFSFMLPLEYYSGSYVDYFPSFALLVNLAIPLLLIMILRALVAGFKRIEEIHSFVQKKEFLKREKRKKIAKTSFQFIADITLAMIIINGFIFVFERFFSITPNGFAVFALLIATMYLFLGLKSRYPRAEAIKYLAIVLFFGNLLVRGDFSALVGFLRTILVFALFIGLLKAFLKLYVREEETEEVLAHEVEEGMVLTKEWKAYFSEKISKMKKNDKHEHFRNVTGGGLSKRQAEIIRELFEDDVKYRVEICKTIPFAPFMLTAVFISLITKSSFMPYIINFFDALIHF